MAGLEELKKKLVPLFDAEKGFSSGSTLDPSDFYMIVDRPTQGHRFLSREYVQPQWVYDCINARIILPTEDFMAGRVPPPHLSQFMDNEAEGYVPKYADTIKRFQAAARKEVLPMPGVVGDEELDNPQNLLAEGIINRAKAIEAAERKRKMSVLQEQYHSELKKELHGEQFYSIPSAIKHESAEDTGNGEDFLPELQRVAEDAANMSKVVMSCKKRRLYEAMKIGEEQKKAETGRIKERKRRLTESENLK